MKFRKAEETDVLEIVKLLADDELGKTREKFEIPLPESYLKAFEKINNDANQELIVVENEENEIIGSLQITYIQYLTYQGGIRAQIEGVRIRKQDRGKGYGEQFFRWCFQHVKEKGVHMVQLASDKKRPEAIRFYLNLGFEASHEGMKLHLD